MVTTSLYHPVDGKIVKMDHELPTLEKNQIAVKPEYVGICSSDVKVFKNREEFPVGLFGHEVVGRVIDIGDDVEDVKEGDAVATYHDGPGFSNRLHTAHYVKVPEVLPMYIIEPLACATNIALTTFFNSMHYAKATIDKNVLINGSGMLAHAAAMVLHKWNKVPKEQIFVVGQSHAAQWKKDKFKLITLDEARKNEYCTIVDLKGDATFVEELLEGENSMAANESSVILAAELNRPISTTFGKALWQSRDLHISWPSPRKANFADSFAETMFFIEKKIIKSDLYWTDRFEEKDIQKAFEYASKPKKTSYRTYIEMK